MQASRRLCRPLTPLAIDELHDLFRLVTNYFQKRAKYAHSRLAIAISKLCKIVVHCTKTVPLRGAYNSLVAFLVQEAYRGAS